MPDPFPQNLATKLAADPETGCMIFTRAKNAKGYGRLKGPDRRLRLAHRVAYEATRGPIPAGLVIDHLCRNPACCNPAHLEAVTTQENTRRANSGLKDAIKTHCPQGHPYDEANIYRGRRGERQCKTCTLARGKKGDWAAYKRLLKVRRALNTSSSNPTDARFSETAKAAEMKSEGGARPSDGSVS